MNRSTVELEELRAIHLLLITKEFLNFISPTLCPILRPFVSFIINVNGQMMNDELCNFPASSENDWAIWEDVHRGL